MSSYKLKCLKNDWIKLVQQVGKSLHPIADEIARWRKILEMPYQEYLLAN